VRRKWKFSRQGQRRSAAAILQAGSRSAAWHGHGEVPAGRDGGRVPASPWVGRSVSVDTSRWTRWAADSWRRYQYCSGIFTFRPPALISTCY